MKHKERRAEGRPGDDPPGHRARRSALRDRDHGNRAARLRLLGLILVICGHRDGIDFRQTVLRHPENRRAGLGAQAAGDASAPVKGCFHCYDHPFTGDRKLRLFHSAEPQALFARQYDAPRAQIVVGKTRMDIMDKLQPEIPSVSHRPRS